MVDATIVIPCFNERRRLPPYLATLCKRFERDPNVTLVVVDDGSDAGELEGVSDAIEELRRGGARQLRLVRLEKNQGKGAALQSGFLGASTTFVGFVDADGSVDADDCALVLSTIAADPDLDAAIASRVKMLGRTIVRRNSRHALGRLFATVLTKLFQLPVYDSQCGCKFFRREKVLSLLAAIESKRWLWDTELLILLHRRGGRIREIPVSWHETSGSKLSLWNSLVTVPYELWSFRRTLTRRGL